MMREICLCYSDSSYNNYWKNFCLDNFLFSGISSLLGKLGIYASDPGISCTISCVLWNLLCNSHNLVLPENNLKSKDFASLHQILKLLVWTPKVAKAYIIVMSWLISCRQGVSKRPTVKYYIYVLQIFSDNQ